MKNSSNGASKSLWQYVSQSDFKVPEAALDRTVKNRIFTFLHILKAEESKESKKSKPLVSKDETSALDESNLDRIITPLNWKIPSEALNDALKNWLESKTATDPFKVVLGPPFIGHGKILTTWARSQNFKLINPPSADQILNQDFSYLEQFKQSESVWVIANLEKLYLRHTKGLALVREIFDGLFAGKMGRGVLGCNSWAWSYLGYVFKGDSFSVLIPQAFQAEQMTEFLTERISGGAGSRTVFRQMGDGNLVLVPHSLAKSKSQTEPPKSSWIKYMSEYCRGNPGIAIEYLRKSVRKMATEEESKKPKKPRDNFTDENALWVIPWNKLQRPGTPSDMNRDHARVLYTLLIHGGLPAKLLCNLLPFSVHESLQFLQFLHAAQLIEKSYEIWRVSPFAFPVVRDCLYAEGYPSGL